MDKLERIQRVLAGDRVDRPPVSLWYHFGVQLVGPQPQRAFARVCQETHPGMRDGRHRSNHREPFQSGLSEKACQKRPRAGGVTAGLSLPVVAAFLPGRFPAVSGPLLTPPNRPHRSPLTGLASLKLVGIELPGAYEMIYRL
jgi:hypothetical protein